MPPKKTAKFEESAEDREMKFQALIEELDVEGLKNFLHTFCFTIFLSLAVDSRCAQLTSTTEQIASSLQVHFKMLLDKMPKKARSMKMEDFCREHGGDADQLSMLPLRKIFEKYAITPEEKEEEELPVAK